MSSSVLSLRLHNKPYQFVHVSLDFVNDRRENVFGDKNNRTLRETLAHRRYHNLASVCVAEYPEHLDSPLGEVLLQLKDSGDPFYKRFLNRYGDLTYSTFSVADPTVLRSRGVYVYCADGVLMYIGRSKDSMRNRVNQGYGRIHPKNCFRDGQATNCHLNALITSTTSDVTLWLCQMDGDREIDALEHGLIQQYAPPWNIQRR